MNTLTRLILWSVGHSAEKTKVTTLSLFLRNLLEDDAYCVFTESTDLTNPTIKQGNAGINLASDGERLLIGRVEKKLILKLVLWWLPPFTIREYASLKVVAIASVKDRYAHIQWLDEDFAEHCAILYENIGRTFYVMYCTKFEDRVRFKIKYSWDSIARRWREDTDETERPEIISEGSTLMEKLKYYWYHIIN